MASLTNAFDLHDIERHSKNAPRVSYIKQCIYCDSTKVMTISNDAGSVLECFDCKTPFPAIQQWK